MKYQFKGSLEIRIPEGVQFEGTGDSKQEAIIDMLRKVIDEEYSADCIKTDYLVSTRVRKVFKVEVVQTFKNWVEVDTDDYPDIEDEYDAERYVRDNVEEFDSDFDFDGYTLEDTETSCSAYDTEDRTEADVD